MIPPLLLDIKSDSKVFDMCAAPGSKTAQLIEKLHGDNVDQTPSKKYLEYYNRKFLFFFEIPLQILAGFVLANDENNKRCYLLVHQSLKRLNSPCCLVVNNDAAILPFPRILQVFSLYYCILFTFCAIFGEFFKNSDTWEFLQFDQILCDVPCRFFYVLLVLISVRRRLIFYFSGDGTLRKNVAIWRNWSPYHGYNMHR